MMLSIFVCNYLFISFFFNSLKDVQHCFGPVGNFYFISNATLPDFWPKKGFCLSGAVGRTFSFSFPYLLDICFLDLSLRDLVAAAPEDSAHLEGRNEWPAGHKKPPMWVVAARDKLEEQTSVAICSRLCSQPGKTLLVILPSPSGLVFH